MVHSFLIKFVQEQSLSIFSIYKQFSIFLFNHLTYSNIFHYVAQVKHKHVIEVLKINKEEVHKKLAFK